MRAEFDAIAQGMDKLPPLTGNANEVVVVNAGATGQSSVPRAALIDTTIVDATAKTTPVDADAIPITDSAASNVLKKLTWGNVKATLLTWLQGTVLPSPGPIGSTTPSTGAFTTLSATGNTTLGDASTDTVTVNGSIGIGGVGGGNSAVAVASARLLTGAGLQHGFSNNATFDSTATNVSSFRATGRSQAAAYTIASWRGFEANNPAKGAGSTITDLHGVYVADQTQGTSNYGITSLVSIGAGKWNIYASGTAANYFAGAVNIDGTLTRTATAATNTLISDATGSTTGHSYSRLRNTSGNAYFGVEGSTAATLATGTLAYAAVYGSAANQATQFITNNTVRVTIDSAGNGGWGVVPSAWSSVIKAIDMGAGSAVVNMGSNTDTRIVSNAYYNGTNWIYKNTAAASKYQMSSGAHIWYTAPSGTAGGTIAFTQSLALAQGNTLALEGATSAAGTGIAFPATQLASSNANTLDDYEEGTFTPTAIGLTTGGTGTYTIQTGRYQKVGNKVSFVLNVAWSAHTGTGALEIAGLPFVSNNTANLLTACSVYSSDLAVSASHTLGAFVSTNSTQVALRQAPVGGGTGTSVAMDTAISALLISGTYFV